MHTHNGFGMTRVLLHKGAEHASIVLNRRCTGETPWRIHAHFPGKQQSPRLYAVEEELLKDFHNVLGGALLLGWSLTSVSDLDSKGVAHYVTFDGEHGERQ